MRALKGIDRWKADHRAACVFDGSGIVASYGEIDREFALASVTKLLSAYAVLVAVEERTLRLEDPAGPPGATVAHLLGHASGLGPTDRFEARSGPGTKRIYSNAGFDVLAAVLEGASGMAFSDYLRAGVLEPLAMDATRVKLSPAFGGTGTARNLGAFGAELLSPRLIDATTLMRARSVVYPGISGVLPGFGYMDPCDWGLGFEIKDQKVPHWTGSANSPQTFGHFGQSGTFLWIDPVIGFGLVVLTDRPFDGWAKLAWPQISDALIAEWATPGAAPGDAQLRSTAMSRTRSGPNP